MKKQCLKLTAWAMALTMILALAPAAAFPASAAAGDVDIDTAFEGQFKLDIIAWAESRGNFTGILSAAEISGVEKISVRDSDNAPASAIKLSGTVNSLKGLELFTNLEILECSGTAITGTLDVSALTKLDNLACEHTGVTGLVLTGLTNLAYLYCHNTGITELELSGLTGLKTLSCGETGITELELTGLSSLESLILDQTSITELNLTGLSNLKFLTCDKAAIAGSLDLTGCPNLEQLIICNARVTELVGLSGLTKLKILDCSNTDITELILDGNTGLTTLDCTGTRLHSLNLDALALLQSGKVYVGGGKYYPVADPTVNINDLNGFDIDRVVKDASGKPGFTNATFDSMTNQLTIIDTYYPVTYRYKTECLFVNDRPGAPGDDEVEFGLKYSVSSDYIQFPDKNFEAIILASGHGDGTGITPGDAAHVDELNVSNTGVTGVTGITSLVGIEYFTNLKELNCEDNELTELDVSANTKLEALNCGGNQLTKLDVSSNTSLKELNCADNELTELDVSANTSLEELICFGNEMTALDISQNAALRWLECNDNQLTALDVSKNTALTLLFCGANQLTALDVSKNAALDTLDCGGNQLTALDVSANPLLILLYCHENQLTALDVSAIVKLDELFCYANKMKSLNDVTGWEKHFTLDDVGNVNDYPNQCFLFHEQNAVIEKPGAPRNLTLTPGDGRITAAWEPPASDGGSTITSYKVQLDDGPVTVKTELSHTFTGLTNGTAYTVKVWAVNAEGDSETPATATATCTGETTYAVTVVNGTGGGDYAAGETVSITADAAPAGQTFAQWSSADGVAFASATSVSTTFTMPGKAVTVTAAYRDEDIPTYAVTVVNGTGGGDYAAGETVSITADKTGKLFDKWVSSDGVIFDDENSETTTFVMPDRPVTVTAAYKKITGVGVEVTIDVIIEPDIKVTIMIFLDGVRLYEGTFPKD